MTDEAKSEDRGTGNGEPGTVAQLRHVTAERDIALNEAYEAVKAR